MVKTSTISVHIDHALKYEAEDIFQQLGLTVSQAIMLFYRQVILQQGLPFPVNSQHKASTPTAPIDVRSIRGKYAHLPTSSDQFTQRKQEEIEMEIIAIQ